MSTIITDSLVRYWHGNNGVIDDAWKNIAPNNESDYAHINGATESDNGLYFDGIDDFVSFTAPSIFLTLGTSYTIEVVMTPQNISQASDFLVGNAYSNIASYGLWFEHYYADSWDANIGHWVNGTVNNNSVNNIVIAYDADISVVNYYFNGRLSGTETVTQPIKWAYGSGTIFFGNKGYDGPYRGYLNAIRLYDKALSQEEINQNYSIGANIGLEDEEEPPIDDIEADIVIDGLTRYWNSREGVETNSWGNIAPNTAGHYLSINGATHKQNGLEFDGIDDVVYMTVPEHLKVLGNSYTIELMFTPYDISKSMQIFGEASYVNIDEWGIWYQHYEGNSWESEVGHWITFPANANQQINLVASYNHDLNKVDYYINGSLLLTENIANPIKISYGDTISFGYYAYGEEPFIGLLHLIRIYNRALTSEEVLTNYSVGTNIGFGDEPLEPPIVNIISIDRQKLSSQPNMNRSNILFRFGFDQDIEEWRAVLLGSSYDTGTIIDSGGFVERGSEIITEVNYHQLYGEGENRINFYGKNSDGIWTPYNDERLIGDND